MDDRSLILIGAVIGGAVLAIVGMLVVQIVQEILATRREKRKR